MQYVEGSAGLVPGARPSQQRVSHSAKGMVRMPGRRTARQSCELTNACEEDSNKASGTDPTEERRQDRK